jgi:hypothetical protein
MVFSGRNRLVNLQVIGRMTLGTETMADPRVPILCLLLFQGEGPIFKGPGLEDTM